jgi:hypothetical protein
MTQTRTFSPKLLPRDDKAASFGRRRLVAMPEGRIAALLRLLVVPALVLSASLLGWIPTANARGFCPGNPRGAFFARPSRARCLPTAP